MFKTLHLLSRYSLNSPLSLARNYAFKSDLKIKWVGPERISCIDPRKTGDLEKFEQPEGNLLMANYEKSEELKKADEMIKEMFTLDKNKRCEAVSIYKREMIGSVRRHESDYGSTEVRIAKMTARIRAMQEYMEKFPRNKIEKVKLKELIDGRKKQLRYLRKWDYKRFEWLIEKLNLIFKPYPEKFHWITRKESLRKLTDLHCENVKQDRLEAYKKQLESQQLDFLANKLKNLEFIRNEQMECRVPITVSNEEIQVVKKEHEQLKKKREEEEVVSQKLRTKEDYELNL